MKILFIGNSRLGDAILSTPIINHYNKKKNKITVVCSSLSSQIYSSFSAVDKLIVLEKKKLGRHWLQAYLQLESSKWDIVIDLRNSVLSRLVKKKKVFRFISKNKSSHKVEQYCDLINLKSIKSPVIQTNIFFQKSINNLIQKQKIKKPVLAIAPITNWRRKDWPLENYVSLVKKFLRNKKITFNSIVLLGSENEKYFCNKLKTNLGNKNIYNLAGSLKILEIFELLKQCKLFIGNDSGLTHLAAASKVKTLGLFGPSKDENYRPWGKNSYFIRTPETYSQLVEEDGYNRFENSSLMKGLKVEDVFKISFKIISKNS